MSHALSSAPSYPAVGNELRAFERVQQGQQNDGETLEASEHRRNLAYIYKCSLPAQTEAASGICLSSLPGRETRVHEHERILWITGTANCPQCPTLGQVCHLAALEALVWGLLRQPLARPCTRGLDLGSAGEPWLRHGPGWLYAAGGEGRRSCWRCRAATPPCRQRFQRWDSFTCADADTSGCSDAAGDRSGGVGGETLSGGCVKRVGALSTGTDGALAGSFCLCE